MNPELFTHYGAQIRKKSKRMYRKYLKAIIVSRRNVVSALKITIHYAKEIRLQAKVFKNNVITNQINRYDYEKNKFLPININLTNHAHNSIPRIKKSRSIIKIS